MNTPAIDSDVYCLNATSEDGDGGNVPPDAIMLQQTIENGQNIVCSCSESPLSAVHPSVDGSSSVFFQQLTFELRFSEHMRVQRRLQHRLVPGRTGRIRPDPFSR